MFDYKRFRAGLQLSNAGRNVPNRSSLSFHVRIPRRLANRQNGSGSVSWGQIQDLCGQLLVKCAYPAAAQPQRGGGQ
jgi:hypothetical protein